MKPLFPNPHRRTVRALFAAERFGRTLWAICAVITLAASVL